MMKAFAFALFFFAFSSVGFAEDKNGLRVMITKKTLDRADGRASYMREVNRTMALKGTLKNVGMRDLPAGTLHCTILIKRWGLSETGALERTKKEIALEPLTKAKELELILGDYQIGGHMHGNSDMHVDQRAGWKVTIEHAGKKTDFYSSSNFEALDKRAQDKAG